MPDATDKVRVKVECILPYHLLLPEGDYSVDKTNRIHLRTERVDKRDFTGASLVFTAKPKPNQKDEQAQRAYKDYQEGLATKQAMKLLQEVNRLLRWYRVLTQQPTIVELARAVASPFRFMALEPSSGTWRNDLVYEPWPSQQASRSKAPSLRDDLDRALRSGGEPAVADLNLLDADHAMRVGRFREAVLLCWGAIDSTFVRSFTRMVDSKLPDEWADAKDFLKGIEFGLRHKMTSGLRFFTGISLFRDHPDLWPDLSASYKTRNQIIHEGQSANERDALRALEVARQVTTIVKNLENPGQDLGGDQ